MSSIGSFSSGASNLAAYLKAHDTAAQGASGNGAPGQAANKIPAKIDANGGAGGADVQNATDAASTTVTQNPDGSMTTTTTLADGTTIVVTTPGPKEGAQTAGGGRRDPAGKLSLLV